MEGTFQASVTVWVGEEYARSGAVPEFFEPLRQWLNVWLQRAYVPMGLVGVAGYGWAILETGLLPGWVGWGTIGWSTIFLLQLAVQGGIAPAVVFVPPLVIGLALLVRG